MFRPEDMDIFLLPWLSHILADGPIGAFSTPFSNYNPPYLYLLALASPLAGWTSPEFVIRLVSYAGHAFLGLAIFRLARSMGVRDPARAVVPAMLAPTLLLNAAVLVQCDALWAAAIVLALAAAIGRRAAAMFLWCGIALAFKLQAIFVAPFFVAVALAQRIPFRLWFVAPVAYAAMLLPAWAAGWPLGDLATIYFRQLDSLPVMALNAPNIWMVIGEALPLSFAATHAVALLATLIAALAYIWFGAKRLRDADSSAIVKLALGCALIVPGLLPQMHERYFFLADVLALALVIAERWEWRLILLTQFGSGLAVLAYLTGIRGLAVEGAVAMLLATWLTTRSAFCPAAPRHSSRPRPSGAQADAAAPLTQP